MAADPKPVRRTALRSGPGLFCYICRKSLCSSAWPLDVEFVEAAVVKEHGWEYDFPVSATDWLGSINLVTLPVVEVTDQVNLGSVRCPLTENPITDSVTMHAIEHMVIDALRQRAVHRVAVLQVHDHLMTTVNDILIRLQPLVMVVNHIAFLLCHRYAVL